MLNLVAQLHSQGMTIVMISHNMEDLARLCTRLLVLNQGSVVLEGTPEQVFSQEEQLHAIGLDIPAAQALANRLRARGVNLPQGLYATAEELAAACASLYQAKAEEA